MDIIILVMNLDPSFSKPQLNVGSKDLFYLALNVELKEIY